MTAPTLPVPHVAPREGWPAPRPRPNPLDRLREIADEAIDLRRKLERREVRSAVTRVRRIEYAARDALVEAGEPDPLETI